MSTRFLQLCQHPMEPMPSWRILAASVRGQSHEHRGSPCQDAYSWKPLAAGGLVIAVADGAGSAQYSDVGSNLAARTAVHAVAEEIGTEWRHPHEHILKIMVAAFADARNALHSEATQRNIAIRELATTLILVVASPVMVIAVQVGDGAVVLRDRQSQLLSLTQPQTGEHINETTFLTSREGLQQIRSTVWHGRPSDLAVFSDGLQMLALNMPQAIPHAPFFNPLFGFVHHMCPGTPAQAILLSFLGSDRIRQRTDDDVTLFLAHLEG